MSLVVLDRVLILTVGRAGEGRPWRSGGVVGSVLLMVDVALRVVQALVEGVSITGRTLVRSVLGVLRSLV